MLISRVQDWEPRLLAWLESCDTLPFSWGRHDCCTFAAGAIRAQTDVDFYEPFAGRYSTQRGSARVLRRSGFADLFGPFDAALGRRVAPLLCQRGDIVSDGEAVGVAWYRAGPCALFVGAQQDESADFQVGLVDVPVSRIKWGWNIV